MSDRSMKIELDVVGVGKTVRELQQVANSYKGIAAAQKQATGGASAGRGAAGPMARLERARATLAEAFKSGDRGKIFDARVGEARAQLQVKRGQDLLNGGGDFFSTVKQIDQSLKGLGLNLKSVSQVAKLTQSLGQASQAADALGVAGTDAAAGAGAAGAEAAAAATGLGAVAAVAVGVVAVVGLVIVGLKALAENVLETSRKLSQIGHTERLLGSRSSAVPTLMAMGFSPGDIESQSRGLRDRLASDPAAMNAAAALGLRPHLDRKYQSVDEAADFLTAARKLAEEKDDAKRLRLAAATHSEALLDFASKSESARDRIVKNGEALAKVADPDTIRRADEFNTALQSLGVTFDTLKMSFAKPFVGSGTEGINGLNDTLRGLNVASEWLGGVTKGIILAIPGMRELQLTLTLLAMLGKANPDKNKNQNPQIDTTNQHLADMAALMRQGLFGDTGGRAGAALGGHMHGAFFERALEAKALRYGALSL